MKVGLFPKKEYPYLIFSPARCHPNPFRLLLPPTVFVKMWYYLRVRNLFQKLLQKPKITKEPEKLVKYSVNKYKNTYKWLEDYDQNTEETTKILADTRIVQDTLRAI